MREPLLALDGIRKRFGRVTVADGVSFTVGPADAVGVVGPNGAGKTSLFGIIAGDLAPDGGTVTFGGRDDTTVGAAHRPRRGMGSTRRGPRPYPECRPVAVPGGRAQRRGRYACPGARERRGEGGVPRHRGDRGGADRGRHAGRRLPAMSERQRATHGLSAPLLEVRDLTVYHGQLRALTGVSLTVEPGEVVAIIGANGAGKSTLLGAIAGVHRPAGGAILLDGDDLGRATPERRGAPRAPAVPRGRASVGPAA